MIERPYCDDFRYCAFVDPSGGSNDSFTLAISHLEADRPVLDLLREGRPPFSPESVVAEFCETLAAYRIKGVHGDRYAGEWPREQFRKRGVSYEPADKTASQLFIELLPLINGGQVGLLDHRRLIDQLVGLERRTSFGTGKDTVGHAPGAHDDVANAVAGALLSATAKRSELRIGTIDVDGRVHWKDEDPERPHVRYVVLTEREDLKRRGLL